MPEDTPTPAPKLDMSRFLAVIQEVEPEATNVIAPPMMFGENGDKNHAHLTEVLNKGLLGGNLPAYMRTKNAKEIFQTAFELIGGIPRLAHWANENPEKFYNLYSKLISLPTSADAQPAINIQLGWLSSRNTDGGRDVVDVQVKEVPSGS